MNGFLSKPIVIEELIGTLQKNIEQVSLQIYRTIIFILYILIAFIGLYVTICMLM